MYTLNEEQATLKINSQRIAVIHQNGIRLYIKIRLSAEQVANQLDSILRDSDETSSNSSSSEEDIESDSGIQSIAKIRQNHWTILDEGHDIHFSQKQLVSM